MKKLLLMTTILILLAGIVNAAATISSADLEPTTADTTTDLMGYVTCSGNGTLTAHSIIYKNDVVQVTGSDPATDGVKTKIIDISNAVTTKTDVWKFDVKCEDNQGNSTTLTSNSVTIGNSAPVASNAALAPTNAIPTTLFTCSGTSTDADSDSLTELYRFVRGSTTLQDYSATSTYQCSASTCPIGSSVMCKYKASDGSVDSNIADSNSVTISTPASAISISNLALGSSSQEKSNTDEDDFFITGSKSFTVTNTGTKTLSNIVLSDNIATKFNISYSDTDLPLDPGASTTVTVNFIVPEDIDAFDPDANNPQTNRAFNIGAMTVSATDGTNTVTDTNSVTMETENKLEIYRLYVIVEGDSEKVDDGDEVDKISPGDKIEVRLIADSKYSKSSNVDMTNIEFSIEIDEGDLNEDESDDISDIDAGDDREETTLDFTIDTDADEDTYSMKVVLQGEDSYDSVHGEEWEIDLTVEKEDEEITVKSAVLSPDTMSCARIGTLNLKLENTGKDDSDEITVVVKNDALGLFSRTRNIDLNDGDDYSKAVGINVGDSVAAGTYSISIFTYFDDNTYEDEEISDFQTVDLKIQACGGTTVTPDEPDEPTQPEEDETTVIVDTGLDEDDVFVPSSGEAAVAREPISVTAGRDWTFALIVLGYIVAIAVGIFLLAALFSRRD